MIVLGLTGAACDGDGADAVPGCGQGDEIVGRPLRVATTVAPITSIVAGVAGRTGTRITGVVPEGADSHTFEPRPSTAATLAGADVVFVNGLMLEQPTIELAAANLAGGAEICALGAAVLPPQGWIFDFSFPAAGGRPNPHLWTNPPMAAAYARLVADVLGARDPARAAGYEANADTLVAAIDALSAAMREATATLPPSRRLLLTYHDAYAYFARDFGWTVIGAIQPASFAEPAPRDVADLIAQVRATRVPAIFGSEVFPSPVLERIAAETGVRYVDVLRDDDLPGAPGDPEHSWLGLMRFNFVTMVEALGGDATALHRIDVTGAVPDEAEYPQ